MATREVVVYVCDRCGSEDMVDTHTLYVDGNGVEFDLCPDCWQGVVAQFADLHKMGRKPEVKKVTKRGSTFRWPGEEWQFSSHALLRMGERHIRPEDVIEAADNPTTSRPGREPELEVRARHGVKAVVNPARRIVVTVAKRDEEVERVS